MTARAAILIAALVVAACGCSNSAAGVRSPSPSLRATTSPETTTTATPTSSPSPAVQPCLPADLDGQSGTPIGRNNASMTFDEGHSTLLITGGVTTLYACRQPALLWQWNGSSWRTTSGEPPGTILYDSVHHRSLVLGPKTESWDGAAWTPITGPTPSGAAAFDALRGQAIVYAVTSDGAAQTWVLDGSSWVLRKPDHEPPARLDSQLAWDPADGVVVMWNGYIPGQVSSNRTSETWTWDGSDWKDASTTLGPRAVEDAALGSGGDGVVAYTTSASPGATRLWKFTGGSWLLQPGTPPPPRSGAVLAYDPGHHLTYLFGGDLGDLNGGKTNELWTYDGTEWKRVSPPA
jgi:hypothetical protein